MTPSSIYAIAPASMPELLLFVAVVGLAVTVCVVALAVLGPDLWAEARTWFEPEPADDVEQEVPEGFTRAELHVTDIEEGRRRRELHCLVVGGSRRAS